MRLIIRPNELQKHKIEKYCFRHVGDSSDDISTKAEKFELKELKIYDMGVVSGACPVELAPTDLDLEKTQDEQGQEEPTQNKQELLNQIDELSSKLVKLEMQSEKQEVSHAQELEQAKKQSFDEGSEEAKKQNEEANKARFDEYHDKLTSSIAKLDEVYNSYTVGLEHLEQELVGVAMEIAQEVIAKELSENSKHIARSLAVKLLENLKDATKIVVKVSPSDGDFLMQSFENKKIKVETDDALSPGGVVIMSNIGSIRGDVKKRFEQIKRYSLDEND